MSLSLPANFENDIQGRDTALTPIILIGKRGDSSSYIYISTGFHPSAGMVQGYPYYPILLNIPSLKESIDVEKRNYKISSVNLDISNYEYNGQRFSEVASEKYDSLINVECRIYWFTPSTTTHGFDEQYSDLGNQSGSDTWGLQVFNGDIRRYTHDDEKVKIVVEDRSQATLHMDLPLPKDHIEVDANIKDAGKPIPIVYGHVDRSPCVIKSSPAVDEWGIEAGNIDVLIDRNDSSSKANGISPLSLYINENWVNVPIDVDADIPDQNTYDVLGYSQNTVQYTFANNIIQLQSYINPDDDDDRSPMADNRIVGYEFLKSGMTITPLQARSTYWSAEHENRAWYTTLGVDSPNSSFEKNGILMGSLLREPDDGDWGGSSYLYDIEGTSDDITCCEAFYGDPGRDDKHEETFVGCRITTGAIDSGSFEAAQGLLYYKIKVNIGNADTWDGGVYNFIQLRVGGSYESMRHELYTNYGALSGASWQNPNNSEIENVFNIEGDTDSLLIYLRLDDSSDASLGRMAAKFEIQDLYLHNYLLIKDAINQDFYANVNGRAMTQGELLIDFPDDIGTIDFPDDIYAYISPTAPTVIAHILENELGQSGIDATGTYDAWKYDFTVDKKINSKKLIEGIASASPYIPRFDNMGNFKFDVIPMNGGTAEHTIKEADVIDFSFSRTKIEDVKTKIEFKYNWDYARGEFNDSVEADISIISPDYKFEYYGFTEPYTETINGVTTTIHPDSTLVIDDDRSKYIRHPDTAQAFADWYLMWSCNQHLKMKIKLPLKYMDLEIGDFVDFDAILGGVKPYGINYIPDNGSYSEKVNFQDVFKNFLITSTNKTLEWVEVECIQMHNLDSGYISVGGCTEEDALNYNGEATYNDGSCEYSEEVVNITDTRIDSVSYGTSSSSSIDVYPHNFTDGLYAINDLGLSTEHGSISIDTAEITLNEVIHSAEIGSPGNGVQNLSFINSVYTELFSIDDFVDGSLTYDYTFQLTTSEGFTYNHTFTMTYIYRDCVTLGDLNGDGGFNVMDIVTLANCVLDGDCSEIENGCAGDLNGDGGFNVMDIVTLANCVLAGDCG